MTRRYALRDDQWERIKDFCRDNPAMLGPTARITAFLLKRSYSVIGPESHGETFLNV